MDEEPVYLNPINPTLNLFSINILFIIYRHSLVLKVAKVKA